MHTHPAMNRPIHNHGTPRLVTGHTTTRRRHPGMTVEHVSEPLLRTNIRGLVCLSQCEQHGGDGGSESHSLVRCIPNSGDTGDSEMICNPLPDS